MITNRAMLVYQGGIANVFAVECSNLSPFGRKARLLTSTDFRTAEAYARGLAAAGIPVHSAWCNLAGDITSAHWYPIDDRNPKFTEMPFSDQIRPVWNHNLSTIRKELR